MSQLITATATRPRPSGTGRTPTVSTTRAERGRSRLRTVIEALAYAGAYLDPFGILAVERLRQAREEAERHDQPLTGRRRCRW